MRVAIGVATLLAACGGGKGTGDDFPGDGGPDAAPPVARCDAPPLYDTSAPTATVGDGTPGSCTAAALQSAATGGGTIVFDCGTAPVTIPIAQTITFTK